MSDDLPAHWRGPRSPRRFDSEQGLQRPTTADPNSNTITRIVELLINATAEGKIHWFRDNEYFAVTYFPMLATSFRLQVGGVTGQVAAGYMVGSTRDLDPSRASFLTIAFIDNKEFRCLATAYPKLHNLATLVWSTFEDDFQRDRSERLEWLEKALRQFLPMVVSSSVEDE